MSDFQSNQPTNNTTSPIMSVKDWLLTFVVMMIPIVNLVMMIIWAIKAENPNKRNYFIASWIILAIVIVIYIILFMVFGAALIGAAAGSGQFN